MPLARTPTGLLHPLIRLPLLSIPLFLLYVGLQLGIHYAALAVSEPLRPALVCVAFVLAGIVMAFLYRRAIRRLERRDAVELGRNRLPDLFWGVLLGLFLLTAVQATTILAGAETIVGFSGFARALPVLLASLFAAIGEEIVFRGVIYRLLEEAWGRVAALALSAALFGGLHLLNPGATWTGVIAIALEAGIMLGLAYSVTGSLWFPIGIHLGWNFCEGGVFSSAISGTASRGMFAVQSNGSTFWTGGTFGLEASVPAVVICLLAAAAMAARLRRPPVAA